EPSVMIQIANEMGLDGEEIVRESELPSAEKLLYEDFALVSRLGARGFPTIVMINEENKGVKVVGARSLEAYVDALSRVLSEEKLEPKQQPSLASLLKKEQLL